VQSETKEQRKILKKIIFHAQKKEGQKMTAKCFQRVQAALSARGSVADCMILLGRPVYQICTSMGGGAKYQSNICNI